MDSVHQAFFFKIRGAVALSLFFVTLCSTCTRGDIDESRYERGEEYIRGKLANARRGEFDHAFSNSLFMLTRVNMSSGKYRTAIHTAEPLLEYTEIEHGPSDPSVAMVLEMLAEIYSNVDRLSDSVPLLERARAIYCVGANNEISCVRTLNSLGATFLLLDKPEQAEPPLLQALSLGERIIDRSALTPTLGLLARVYAALGDDTRAVLFQKRMEANLPRDP